MMTKKNQITTASGVKKLRYTYTNKAKILFYFTILFFFLLRLAINVQIRLYDVEGYQIYLLPTILYYALIFFALTLLFFAYKKFYTLYDGQRITYVNQLLRRSRSIAVEEIRFARMDTLGIYLYRQASPAKEDKADLFIPFFRFGIIDVFSADTFFRFLIDQPHIRVEKKFKILPGYTNKWRWVSILYAVLAICMLLASSTYLQTIIVLYQAAEAGLI